MELYLNNFDPRIFDNTAFSQNDNKFVNPHSFQKRLFISNNPTFIYLEKNASATLVCPKFPASHIPIIWHRLVKGKCNPIFSGPMYSIEFPNYHHSGLIKCSFISSKRKYEHTFILSFQNKNAVTLQPTAKMYTTKSMHPETTSLPTPVQTNTQVQTTIQQPTTFRTTTTLASTTTTLASTIVTPTMLISQQTSTAFSASPPLLTPLGQNENDIMGNVEHSIKKKILFLDIKLQRHLLDFLMSPLGTKLSKLI